LPLLNGSLPTEQGMLSKLKFVSFNDLPNIVGTIPTELGALTELTTVYTSQLPLLTSTLPTQLGALTNLSHLYFYYNKMITGTIPTQLGALTELTFFEIDDLALSGKIPTTELGALDKLTYLDISDLQFLSGSLPSADPVGQAHRVDLVESIWQFGPHRLPSETDSLTSLRYLDLRWTSMTTSFPSQLGALTSLTACSDKNGSPRNPCFPPPAVA
jgi:Leucine-rich repeat (LRR) protein